MKNCCAKNPKNQCTNRCQIISGKYYMSRGLVLSTAIVIRNENIEIAQTKQPTKNVLFHCWLLLMSIKYPPVQPNLVRYYIFF
jgi:hypothetical protein